MRSRPGTALGLWERAYGSAQSPDDRLGRFDAVVRLVRIQRRQRSSSGSPGYQRVRGHQYCDGGGGPGVDGSGMALSREAHGAGSGQRGRRRPGGDYAGVRGCGTGLFASKAINSGGADGLFFGNPGQLWLQFIAVLAAWALAFVGTFVILKVVDWTMGLRVANEDEQLGLDLSQHEERAYSKG